MGVRIEQKLTDPRELSRWYQAFLDALAAKLAPTWRVLDHGTPNFKWRVFVPPQPCDVPQGWKIHVSAAAVEARLLCETVVNHLVERRAHFKLPATVEGIVYLNSGLLNRIQLGKIITVYPRNNQEAGTLAAELDGVWPLSAGPAVVTDLAVRAQGAISFRYGAFGGGGVISDSIGRHAFALRRPDGSLTGDHRDSEGLQPEWAPNPPLKCVAALDDREAIVAVEGRSYLPLSLLHNGPRGTVTLGLDAENGKSVIIKTALRGACGDLRGVDAGDRLKNEYAVLHQLARDGLAPQAFGISGGQPMTLVMEDLEGTSLEKLGNQERIASLALLAEALVHLHATGVVHRDVKLSNALISEGALRLIDFELATKVGEIPTIADCGTRSYVPPEGSAVPAHPASDVFALGVCISHSLLGHDPALLPPKSGRLIGFLNLLGLHPYALLTRRLLDPDWKRRPSMVVVAAELKSLVNCDTRPRVPDARQQNLWRNQNWAKRSSLEAGFATRAYSTSTADLRWWKNAHAESDFQCEGISLGAAGIILGLASIDQSLHRRSFDEDIRKGAAWLSSRPNSTACGLFTGNSGIALALTVAGQRLGTSDFICAAKSRLAAVGVEPARNFDLLSGSAGQLWAGSLMAEILNARWPLECVEVKAHQLLRAARFHQGVVSWEPDENSPDGDAFTGAAHGSAGIAMALGIWGNQTENTSAIELGIEVFRSLQVKSTNESGGQFPCTLGDSSPIAAAGHWCHGLAGYLWCLLQAFGDNPKLEHEIDWAVDGLSAVTPAENSTYCHGLAGQLELWRVLRTIPRHENFAKLASDKTAAALRLIMQRRKGLSVWSSEDPQVFTPDFWLGFLGPASSLALYTAGHNGALLSRAWLQTISGVKVTPSDTYPIFLANSKPPENPDEYSEHDETALHLAHPEELYRAG
jgi:serine/threonine protein kinase